MIVKLLFVVCNLIKEKLMKFSSLYICFRIIMSKIVSEYKTRIVENNGFEPLTPCVQSRCSSQLS